MLHWQTDRQTDTDRGGAEISNRNIKEFRNRSSTGRGQRRNSKSGLLDEKDHTERVIIRLGY